MSTHTLRRLAVVLSVVMSTAAVATPVAASTATGLQIEIDAYLAAHPGGQQISTTEISYGGGALVVAVAPEPGIQGSPDCPSGWFCFYDRTWYGYPRGKLSDCGWQFLDTWSWQDRIDSVHNNQSFGTVYFYDEAGANDPVLFSVGPHKALADAGWARNRADYVFRLCA